MLADALGIPATPRGRSFYQFFYSCGETEAEKSETGLDGGSDVHSGSPAAVYVLPTADHPQLGAPQACASPCWLELALGFASQGHM